MQFAHQNLIFGALITSTQKAHVTSLSTMVKSKTYPLEVLLIEGDSKKAKLVKKILMGTKIQYNLHIVDGENDTIAFLQKKGKHKNSPIPDAIIHGITPESEFERKIIDYLNAQVLFLKVTDNKIEITKSNKHIIDHKHNKHGITHILEAIVSVKKFMGSLIKLNDPDNHKITTKN